VRFFVRRFLLVILIDGQVERPKTIWYSASSRRGCSRCSLTGTTNEEKNYATTISLDIFKDKATADKFIGKVGDVVTV
jgi:trigger factor